MKRLVIHLLVLGMITNGSLAIAGTVIKITNTDKNFDAVLSDLVVYDQNNNSKVILEPMKSSDDVTVRRNGGTTIANAGFEIKKYIISETTGRGEFQTAVFKVEQVMPVKLGFLENPNPLGQDVFLAIDYSLYNFDPPSEGTILGFTNGLNSTLPGWFVGTAIDFDQGIVSNPYTGSAEINFTGFEVATVVPEPSTLMLLGIGTLSLLVYGWRQRKRAEVAKMFQLTG